MGNPKKTHNTRKQKKHDETLISIPSAPTTSPRSRSNPEVPRVNPIHSTTIPLAGNELDPGILQEIVEKLPKTEEDALEDQSKRDYQPGQ